MIRAIGEAAPFTIHGPPQPWTPIDQGGQGRARRSGSCPGGSPPGTRSRLGRRASPRPAEVGRAPRHPERSQQPPSRPNRSGTRVVTPTSSHRRLPRRPASPRPSSQTPRIRAARGTRRLFAGRDHPPRTSVDRVRRAPGRPRRPRRPRRELPRRPRPAGPGCAGTGPPGVGRIPARRARGRAARRATRRRGTRTRARARRPPRRAPEGSPARRLRLDLRCRLRPRGERAHDEEPGARPCERRLDGGGAFGVQRVTVGDAELEQLGRRDPSHAAPSSRTATERALWARPSTGGCRGRRSTVAIPRR